jgi:hypothetical protein
MRLCRLMGGLLLGGFIGFSTTCGNLQFGSQVNPLAPAAAPPGTAAPAVAAGPPALPPETALPARAAGGPG